MTLIQREHESIPQQDRDKATRILARSIYRELRGYGYEPKQIVSLSSELISLVTRDIGER